MANIIFIHGLESSGKGFKGQFLKRLIPNILTPDFRKFDPRISVKDLLRFRMIELKTILNAKKPWIIIASSFGALMGALYTCQNPEKVSKLILLAPYLSNLNLDPSKYSSVDVPVIVFHGENDKVVLLTRSKARAEELFTNLIYNIVDDDHILHKTVKTLDWNKLIFNI